MMERIQQLRAEGEAAIAAAAERAPSSRTCGSGYLGRKAELPQLLRGVRDLPPDERGAGRQGGQRDARRARGADRGPRRASWTRASWTRGSARTASTSRCPGDPLDPIGRLHLVTQTRRELEDVFAGLGFDVVEGPEVETVHYNFDALNHARQPPGARVDRHVLRVRRGAAAHAHLARADPRDGAAAAAALHRRAGTRVPAGLRRHAHATVPPARGPRGGRAHHARRSARHAAGLRPRRVRTGARGAHAAAFLPVHRAQRGGGRLVLPLRWPGATWPTARGARCARASAGSRSSAPAWWTRTSSPTCARTATTRSGSRASPSAWASSAIAMLKHEVPDLRLFYDNDVRFLEQFG